MDREISINECRNSSIRLSVVSHGQDDLVEQLLVSVARYCRAEKIFVTVTRNLSDPSVYNYDHFPFPVTVLENGTPKGFGANHNQAFITCEEDYFCVVNPDILLTSNIFDVLVACFSDQSVGVVAPALVDSEGAPQDSARRYPTPARILRRIVEKLGGGRSRNCLTDPMYPDWVAGMFMLFPTQVYREIGGFDEGYYMYCEDADICRRLCLRGSKAQLVAQVKAVHNARRASHRSTRHLRWHLSSLLRFFIRHPFYRL